jgi:uncharacterized protein (DUF885 family)
MRYSLILFLLISTALCSFATEIADAMNSYRADKSAIERLLGNNRSDEYYKRIDKLYADWLIYLEKQDYKKLSQDGKVDYHIFKNYLQKEKYFHLQAYNEFKEVKHVADFASGLYQFNENRRRAIQPKPKEISKVFSDAEEAVTTLTKNLGKSTAFNSWQTAELASEVISALRNSTDNAYKFYYDYDPEFSWWTKTPYEKLAKALKSYEEALKMHYDKTKAIDDGSGIIGKPIGREALEKEFAFEYIPYTPEELIAEGKKQYAWCEAEMIKASQKLGFGKDWKKALEHTKDKYLPAGEWPEEVGKLAVEAVDYLEKNDLLTIPETAKETWRMVMISQEAQKLNPFFLGGESIWISYPTSGMTHTEKMMSLRGNNPHFSRATVHHELIPGHHLQQYMNARHYPHRNNFGTAFWVEGWPLYWEFTLYERGYPRNEEDKIGMLFWRMHRAARIIFSLEYHLGNMTPQQCIDFLVEKVGHERFNAEAEVRRSFTSRYGPLYQLAYMTGGLQVMALKKECVDSGKMTLKQFNDTFIRQNNMPIELLRTKMLNIDLPKDYKSNWKFLADHKRP